MNKQTICCVAGKSGGHIIPCLTIASAHPPSPSFDKLRTNGRRASPKLLFFSANTPLDTTILSNNQAVTWHIPLPLTSCAGSYIKTIINAFVSFVMSFFYLCKHRPTKIITTGGIVAIPPCIAGFILRIPIIIYSLDAVPGKAIRFLTPFAQSIHTCFTSSQHYFPAHKCTIAPYPIKFTPDDLCIDQQYAQKNLELSSIKKTILILGGSQGSLFLNEFMKRWIADLSFSADAIQIIHQTGALDSTDWKSLYASKNITAHVFSYHPDLALMYSAADLIICRAGAGTLFEIKFFNKQCIIIPLSTQTTSHQIDNAHAMSAEYPELFYAIAQDAVECDPTLLYKQIFEIFNQHSARQNTTQHYPNSLQ